MTTRAIRGRILSFDGDPATEGASALCYLEDGAIIVRDGIIAGVGEASQLLPGLGHMEVVDHRPHLVSAGFIDPHIHMPQTRVIASYGARLLDWLNRYTFPAEARYADPEHARKGASFFLDELLRNGTTTAVVFCTVHPISAEALLAESERRGMRMIAGKVMMDRNAPGDVTDTPDRSYEETKALFSRWHGRGRLEVAVTPRFAITSSPEQLEVAGTLMREHPGAAMQTHLAENEDEIAFAAELYPQACDYLDIYDRHRLLGERSLFGHCIHLSDREVARMAETRSVAVFCPTSNLFIGSGLFDRARMRGGGVRVALATDVGGGTSYSMLRTAAEGYKVLQLRGQNWPALEMLYAMTLGNARAAGVADHVGSIAPGKEADLVVLDSASAPALAHRMETADTLEEELFALVTLGDDRAAVETYVMGEACKPRPGRQVE